MAHGLNVGDRVIVTMGLEEPKRGAVTKTGLGAAGRPEVEVKLDDGQTLTIAEQYVEPETDASS